MASKVAAQMYTVREFTKTAKSFEDSLCKIAEIGYPAVQLSAVGCMNGDNPEVTPEQARQMLDQYGLKCVATHRNLKDFTDNLENEIAFHKAIGCDYAAIGSMPKEYRTRDGFRQFIKLAQGFIPRLKQQGIRWGYHNHAFEFVCEKPGYPNYRLLVDEAPSDLMLEVDTYWVAAAGGSPVSLLKLCKGRIPVMHFKDMNMHPTEGAVMCPVGEGNLDWDGIIKVCEAGGAEWYCVEQDRCYDRDPFECLASSFKFLTSKGL